MKYLKMFEELTEEDYKKNVRSRSEDEDYDISDEDFSEDEHDDSAFWDGHLIDEKDDGEVDLSLELEYKLRTISDDSDFSVDDFFDEFEVDKDLKKYESAKSTLDSLSDADELFDRVKEIFDINSLEVVDMCGFSDEVYSYYLEETDSPLGFIKMEIIRGKVQQDQTKYTSKKRFSIRLNYYVLLIDNETVDASEKTKKEIFDFFDERYKAKQKIRGK